MNWTDKTLKEIRSKALKAAGVSNRGHVEVGLREGSDGPYTANNFKWAEDADLTDTEPLMAYIGESGLVELDLYVYNAERDLVTNVAAFVQDGIVLDVMESVGNYLAVEAYRESLTEPV